MFMKFILVSITIIIASQASAVELEQATNSQILLELEYRLNNGSGGGGGTASVTYSCDSYGYLRIEVFSADGELSSESEDLGDYATNCSPHLADLNRFKSRITQVTQIGLCDSYGYLRRFGLRPSGEIQDLGARDMGTFSECWATAEVINSRS